jgi:translation elongation factor EF-1beta
LYIIQQNFILKADMMEQIRAEIDIIPWAELAERDEFKKQILEIMEMSEPIQKRIEEEEIYFGVDTLSKLLDNIRMDALRKKRTMPTSALPNLEMTSSPRLRSRRFQKRQGSSKTQS